MILPSLRDEIAAAADPRSPGAEEAAWSVAISPAVARSIALQLNIPDRNSDMPSEAHRRIWSHRFGRFPGSFVQPDAPVFSRAMTAAAREDNALLRIVSPLVGAALFGVPRDVRRHTLAMLPEAVRFGALRWFETLRSTTRPPDEVCETLAGPFALDATWGSATLRSSLLRRAAIVFTPLWWDELRVAAGGSLAPPARPVALDRSRAAAQWWVSTINDAGR